MKKDFFLKSDRTCLWNRHRIIEWPGLEGTFKGHQTSGGADASRSMSAPSITCMCGAEHASPERLGTIPDGTVYSCIYVVL